MTSAIFLAPEISSAILSRTRDQFSNPFFRNKDLHEWKSLVNTINEAGLKERQFFHPVLDTFVRALPLTYQDIAVADATVLKFVVTGEAGDVWYLVGEANRWSLFQDVALQPVTVVTMDQETCWRLFTKGMSKNQARERTAIEGDQKLGEKLLETVSIIA